jgi:predicted thioesterase
VTKVDGRQIEFAVRATEGGKEIGVGSHSRVVIDVAKFPYNGRMRNCTRAQR